MKTTLALTSLAVLLALNTQAQSSVSTNAPGGSLPPGLASRTNQAGAQPAGTIRTATNQVGTNLLGTNRVAGATNAVMIQTGGMTMEMGMTNQLSPTGVGTNGSRMYSRTNRESAPGMSVRTNVPVRTNLPPGIEKRDELPPGLQKQGELPPGLSRTNTGANP